MPSLVAAAANLPNRYRPRPGGYCDGSVASPHSGELRLVSVSIGKIEFPADASTLSIRALGTSDELLIRGEDKRPGRNYRIDGTMRDGRLQIDRTAAMAPASVDAANLGLVAWRARPNGLVYVPILAGADPAAPVRVSLRSDAALVRVARQVCEGSTCGPQQIISSNVQDGGLIEFDVPRQSSARTLRITVIGLRPGNQYSTAVVDVLAPGR